MSKILLVEDDRKIALALSLRLKAKGHAVLIAYDALAGLTQAAQNKPDLVLLDVGMPAGGGFTLAERMQNLVSTIGIPFIFLTANTDPATRSRAMELGAAAYFQKPYDPEELLLTIDKVLGAVSS